MAFQQLAFTAPVDNLLQGFTKLNTNFNTISSVSGASEIGVTTGGGGTTTVQGYLDWLKDNIGGGGGGNVDFAFRYIAVPGQSTIQADLAIDTLNIVAGTNVTLTTNAGTNSLTINSTGGSGDATWGGITGTLADQNDLQTALNSKEPSIGDKNDAFNVSFGTGNTQAARGNHLHAFLSLSDSPASYSTHAEKFVRVNSGGNALEFADPPAGANLGTPDGLGYVLTSDLAGTTSWTPLFVDNSANWELTWPGPVGLSFEDVANATAATLTLSATKTLAGISGTAKVSILNGEYSINEGAFTSVSGTVVNGNTIQLRHTSAASGQSNVSVLSVNHVTVSFKSTSV